MSAARLSMERFALFASSAFLIAAQCCAQPPAHYYDPAEGLSGQSLRTALRLIIDDHTVVSYDGLWSAFHSTDMKGDGKVWDIYSDDPVNTPDYEYTFTSDQCGEYNGEGDCYNREHSFPKDWFNGDVPPMNSDLFHIYPTDGWVNNKRGNLPYGDVGSADYTSSNGSKTGACMDPGYSATVFEPIDAYKGDVARSYFYMMTRYQNLVSGWVCPMIGSGDLLPWAATTLLAWNDMDPVSAKEIARNNAIYALQHNRNPFIDRPEWVHAIWGPTAGVAEVNANAFGLWGDGQLLHINNTEAGTLVIRDVTGRAVLSKSVVNGEVGVPFAAPCGVYIAELTTPNGHSAQRFFW